MAKNIQVAKIVPSSTPAAWSQAYHAGTLTAVVAVTPKEEEDAPSLPIVGKDLLNTFESEYFTLEDKNLASIKDAAHTTYKKSSDTHTISFLVATAIHNTLYLVMAGNGSIFLLRNGKLGTLLEQETDQPTILSSSGFLEHGDIIILASPAFLKIVTKEKLFETLRQNTIHEAAEILTPTIHATSDGDAVAIFFLYEDAAESVSSEIPKPEEPHVHTHHEVPSQSASEEQNFSKPLIMPEKPHPTRKISHRQRLLLTIIVILLIVLGTTSVLTIQRQKTAQNTALFATVYPPAEQKYEEATGLLDLNPTLAHDDFLSAQKMLESAQNKFPKGSQESKQIATLLAKITSSLALSSHANTVAAQKVDATTNDLLSYAASHTDISYLTQDDINIYTADSSGISTVNKKSLKAKPIIPNASTWTSIGGFATYLGNFYLLDTKAGIIKFVPSGITFAKSDYFASGVSPDISQATSIAIDGSIWILESNGTLLKFTKGKQDTFALTGLDTPLSHPTQIVTSVDMDNIYIVDAGNGRLVVADKTGKYSAQYTTGLLKNATQLVVDEKNKTTLFLSGGNVYKITLK